MEMLLKELTNFNKDTIMENLADWLRSQLAARNWTQLDLSKASGVSETSLSRIINKERKPKPETCIAIANALDAPAETVFRLAGLLPESEEEEDAMVAEIVEKFKRLDIEQRRDVLEYVLMRLRRQREKRNGSR